MNDRDQYAGVEARYLLQGEAKRKSIIVGDEERVHRLRTVFDSEDAATIVAEKKLQRIGRNKASISVNLARGNPELTAESPLKLVGFKSEVDAENWIYNHTAINSLTKGNELVTELIGGSYSQIFFISLRKFWRRVFLTS